MELRLPSGKGSVHIWCNLQPAPRIMCLEDSGEQQVTTHLPARTSPGIVHRGLSSVLGHQALVHSPMKIKPVEPTNGA